MTIVIDKDMCDKIATLHYEVESRKAIITTFLANSEMKINDTFNKYQKEYQELYVAYNQAKEQMTSTYNLPTNATWNLDFATCELTYEA